MRQHQPLGDARRDTDGPVGAGRDDPVDVLGPREPVDVGLVLVETSARLSAYAKPGADGSRSTAIT